jgi:UDPglucose 6-dehydrogenase
VRVSIIGTGYVGLVSGVCLAEKGHEITCVDVDQKKVDAINQGICPIYEEGLEDLLQKNINVRLNATTNFDQAIRDTGITLIAVGTPFDGERIDLSYVKGVARQIGEVLRDKNDYHVVVVKSTVVPGTTEDVVLRILEESSGKQAGRDFGVGMNPEFLTEGVAVRDFMYPDRIVMGGIDEKSIGCLEMLYSEFDGVAVIRTNPATAEMIKYVSNSVLATLISFSNEIANLCSAIDGVDVADVMKGVHLAHYFTTTLDNGERVAAPVTSFLEAGCGFGGSCFPKDVKALVAQGKGLGQPMPLLDEVIRTNQRQPQRIVDILKKHFPVLQGLKILVLGLAFKPDTDDVRESPAIPIINSLLDEGAQVSAYDPVAIGSARKVFQDGRINYTDSIESSLGAVDAVVLVTRWEEFRDVPGLLSRQEKPPLFVDGRRMLDKHSVPRYDAIGM